MWAAVGVPSFGIKALGKDLDTNVMPTHHFDAPLIGFVHGLLSLQPACLLLLGPASQQRTASRSDGPMPYGSMPRENNSTVVRLISWHSWRALGWVHWDVGKDCTFCQASWLRAAVRAQENGHSKNYELHVGMLHTAHELR